MGAVSRPFLNWRYADGPLSRRAASPRRGRAAGLPSVPPGAGVVRDHCTMGTPKAGPNVQDTGLPRCVDASP